MDLASLQRWHLSRELWGVREALWRGFAAEEPARAGAHLRLVLVSQGCWNNIPQTRWLKATEIIVFQF